VTFGLEENCWKKKGCNSVVTRGGEGGGGAKREYVWSLVTRRFWKKKCSLEKWGVKRGTEG